MQGKGEKVRDSRWYFNSITSDGGSGDAQVHADLCTKTFRSETRYVKRFWYIALEIIGNF